MHSLGAVVAVHQGTSSLPTSLTLPCTVINKKSAICGPDPCRDFASGPGHSTSLTWPRAAVVVLCGVVTCDMWCRGPFHIRVRGFVLSERTSRPCGSRGCVMGSDTRIGPFPFLPLLLRSLRIPGTELINERLERWILMWGGKMEGGMERS
jgi:hypothetical protein